ncbi:hypothetical protein AZA_40558 [Nitrospirillum viridazoti Y2]|nr:hypothetical protein AZA_40558 [Nitrospirillum amazonense Y2]
MVFGPLAPGVERRDPWRARKRPWLTPYSQARPGPPPSPAKIQAIRRFLQREGGPGLPLP